MTRSDRPARPGALAAAACAGMFVFGIVMAVLGAVLPQISARLQLGLGAAGSLFLVMNFLMLVTLLLLGPAMDRFGLKPPLASGPFLVAAAVVGIGFARSHAELLAAAALLGLGGGALNGATNTLMADLHVDPRRKNAALNLMGVFFGFGALLVPFALGALLRNLTLVGVLAIAAGICACVGAFAALLTFPAPKAPQRLPVGEIPAMLRVPLVPLLAFALFFQSGNEFLLGGYLSSLFQQEMRASAEQSSWGLAGFWASIMAARVFFSRYLLHADAYRTVLWCAALAVAATAGVATAPSFSFAVLMAALMGAALSGIFPTVLGIAGARFQERSGTVFGILFTVALSGGMSVPWIAGHLAEARGLRAAFWLAAAGCVCTFALMAAARRRRAS